MYFVYKLDGCTVSCQLMKKTLRTAEGIVVCAA